MSVCHPHDVTGLILAGGQSTRFGKDKARVVLDGGPMIGHVYDALAPVCAAVLVSVADADTRYPLPRAVRYVVDRRDAMGPLAGLEGGLLAAPTPWVLVVACDMPDLSADVLQVLLDHRSPAISAVVARAPEGRKHPLCACYHRRVLPTVQAHLDAGQRALHRLLDALPEVTYVQVPTAPLRNVNTRSDLENPPSPSR